MNYVDPSGYWLEEALTNVGHFGLGVIQGFDDSAAFGGGQAVAEFFGIPRPELDTTAHHAGRVVGDGLGFVVGFAEFVGAVGGEGIGLTLDSTGVGAIAGVPINAASASLGALSVKTFTNSGANIGNDFSRMLASGNGKNSSGSLNKLDDNYLKRKGIDPHSFKMEQLGKKARIAEYDIYVNKSTHELFILRKPQYNLIGEPPIPTGTKL